VTPVWFAQIERGDRTRRVLQRDDGSVTENRSFCCRFAMIALPRMSLSIAFIFDIESVDSGEITIKSELSGAISDHYAHIKPNT
jgi:hypothetical protein